MLGWARTGEAGPPRTTTVKVTEQVKLAGITITIIIRVKTGVLDEYPVIAMQCQSVS